MVVNQKSKDQSILASKRDVPGIKSYCEALTDNSNKDSHKIKIFCDSVPKGIRIKELNQYMNNENAQLRIFLETTSKQLLLH